MLFDPVVEAKIALERELMAPLWKVCRAYVNTWARASGQMSAWERMGHHGAVEAVLQRHYARVTMVMTGRAPRRNSDLTEAALGLLHLDSLRSRARDHAEFILKSIDRELAAGMAETAPEEHGDGTDHYKALDTKADKPAGYVDRIRQAVGRAIKTLNKKLGLIANAETNPAAEEARQLFAENEARIRNGKLMKRWRSLMDGRERPTHHEGHNTYIDDPIPIETPFQIGGFSMMMPGDQSRGAPLKEVINCRCSAVYTLLNADGTESPVANTPHAPTITYRRNVPKPDPARLRPTSVVTLNGRTNARVVLGDGRTLANMRQVTPSTIAVTVNGKVVARARVANGKPADIVVDPAFRNQGIELLIRRSVRHSHERRPEAVR